MTRPSWLDARERVWAARPAVTDVLVALGCAAGSLGLGVDGALARGLLTTDGPPPLEATIPLAAVTAAAALGRRRRPLLLTVAALGNWALMANTLVVVAAQYTAGAYLRGWRLAAAAAAVIGVVVASLWAFGLDAIVPVALAVTVAPLLLGLWVAARRELVASLRERALRLEREQRLLVEQARTQERARIAREMHDVLAHQVSLMVLHANALGVADQAQRAELTSRIGMIGRAALEELRRLVGVLTDSGEAAPLAPQPGIDDIQQLVEQSRVAGMPVTLELELDSLPRRLPALVEHACYRVVQESLTNVHKHAADAPTSVWLRRAGDTLQLTIENIAPARPAVTGLPRGGHGLVGLGERVRLLGGGLVAEPTLGRGFRVEATIPLAAQDFERAGE